jgi:tetratricopeptide (TPR) repeat protein
VAKLFGDLEAAAKENPRDPVARGKLAMAQHANGLPERALENYQQAIELDRTDPKWWYLAAIIETYFGRYPEALADLDSAVVRAPSVPHVHWRRGLLLLDMGELDRADSSFAAAIRARPNQPVGWIGRARVRLQRGDNQGAIELLEEAVQRRPKSIYVAYAHQLLGTAYRQMGKLEEAKLELARGRSGRAVWSDPWSNDLNEYRVALGSRLRTAAGLIQKGENETAVQLLEELRPENPTHPMLLQYLSNAYLNLGDYEKGKEVLEVALDQNPDDALAHTNMSLAVSHEGDLQEALRLAERGSALNPSLPVTHVQKARVLRRMGKRAEALAAYQEALRVGPTAFAIMLAAAEVAEELQQWEEVESLATRALQQNPQSYEALLRRGKARTMLRKFQGARDDLNLAAELQPNDAQITEAQKNLARRAAGPPGGTP